MSYSQKEIDSVTFYSMLLYILWQITPLPLFSLIGVAFETVATLLGVAIYTVSYAIFVRESSNECVASQKTRNSDKVMSHNSSIVELFYVGGCVPVSCIIHECFNYIHDMDNFLYCQGTNG